MCVCVCVCVCVYEKSKEHIDCTVEFHFKEILSLN